MAITLIFFFKKTYCMPNFTKLLLVVCAAAFLNLRANAQHVYAYITNSGSDNMSIIDVATNTVIGTVALPVGAKPYAVTVLPNGDAYIANNGNSTVTVFSTTNNAIIGTIPLALTANPISLAASPDGSKIYVTNNGDGTVSVISTATNTVTGTITIFGNPTGVAVSPDGSTVYASNGIAGIAVINATTNAIITTISTGAGTLPTGVAITPDGQYLFEVNSNTNTVGVYRTSDYSFVTSLAVGSSPYGIAISPDGALAYVTNTSGSVTVIDATNRTVTTSVADGFGNQPLGVSFTPDGTKAYVVNYGAGNVWVFNTSNSTVIGSPIVVGLNPTSFSSFIASVAFVLPVHFTTFSATETPNHTVQLKWSVQNETDGTYYEVLGSNDGIAFSKKVTISSDPHANASYSWTDISPAAGMNFYRIKSVELSGSINYSQVLRVTMGSSSIQTYVYPNPVKEGTFTLQLNNEAKGLYTIDVVNMAGQRVYRSQFSYTGGSTAQTVNLPHAITRGLYQVVVTNGSSRKVLKLIVD
jgi:YVTN family beta-propeller protein